MKKIEWEEREINKEKCFQTEKIKHLDLVKRKWLKKCDK